MLRRQINHEEYIALSKDEVYALAMHYTQQDLNQLFLIIATLKNNHGYIQTVMQPIHIGTLVGIQTQNGVITVSDIQVFNQVGGQYSSSQTSMSYSDPLTRQIKPTADTIFATPTQIYQVRYPNKDINVRVLNLKSVNFS